MKSMAYLVSSKQTASASFYSTTIELTLVYLVFASNCLLTSSSMNCPALTFVEKGSTITSLRFDTQTRGSIVASRYGRLTVDTTMDAWDDVYRRGNAFFSADVFKVASQPGRMYVALFSHDKNGFYADETRSGQVVLDKSSNALYIKKEISSSRPVNVCDPRIFACKSTELSWRGDFCERAFVKQIDSTYVVGSSIFLSRQDGNSASVLCVVGGSSRKRLLMMDQEICPEYAVFAHANSDGTPE